MGKCPLFFLFLRKVISFLKLCSSLLLSLSFCAVLSLISFWNHWSIDFLCCSRRWRTIHERVSHNRGLSKRQSRQESRVLKSCVSNSVKLSTPSISLLFQWWWLRRPQHIKEWKEDLQTDWCPNSLRSFLRKRETNRQDSCQRNVTSEETQPQVSLLSWSMTPVND